MELEYVILSEVSQRQKKKKRNIYHLYENMKRKDKNESN